MSDFGWGLTLLGVYVLLVVLARWLYIARSNVVWTDAQWRAMTKRLDLQVARDPSRNGRAPVTGDDLRGRVEEIIAQIEAESPHSRVSGLIGWNGSHQIAQWVLMHEAERLVLPMLGHEELVARLERALGQLEELPQHRREAWQDVIHTLLAAKDGPDDERLRRVYQAYLDELLGEIYEASNGKATQLSGLYNRATWVILVALLPLVVLVGLGYGVLLVAGAIGGIVSRMQRLVFSRRIPIAYGSSLGAAVLRADPGRPGGLGGAGADLAAAGDRRAAADRDRDLPRGAARPHLCRARHGDPARHVGALPAAAREAGRGRDRPERQGAVGPVRPGQHAGRRPAGGAAPAPGGGRHDGGRRREGEWGRGLAVRGETRAERGLSRRCTATTGDEMARVKLRTYLSPTLVLLAFDWGAGRSRSDFLGFAIERRPGFWGAASSWLPNRLGFGGPATDGDLPSNTSPVQKFMWWDARIDEQDRGRRFTYTVTPVVGDPAAPRLLSGSAVTTAVDLPTAEQDGIGSWFNRAVVSSQAFSRRFGTGDLSPERLQEALLWLANGMEEVVPEFLDSSERVQGAIYHLTDRRWVIPALAGHPGVASLVYNKTRDDDENHDSVADLAKQVEFFQRTRAAIMHDKFLVRLDRGVPAAVLMGSANFTTEGIATQANLIHTIASPELAALYLERKRLLQDDPTVAKTAAHAGWSDPVEVGEASIRAFFPPEPTRRRASIDAVVDTIGRARSSVVFSLFKPTDQALFDALERHGEAGKLLLGLVNKLDHAAAAADEPAGNAERASVDILHRSVLERETVEHGLFPQGGQPDGFWWERSALPGVGSRFPVFIHHKFVVIDAETAHPVIYTGSANMSNNALHRNDENLLEISGSQRLAAVYFAEFLRLYEHYRARRQIDRPGRGHPALALAKDARWAAKAFEPGTSQFLSRVRLASAPS